MKIAPDWKLPRILLVACSIMVLCASCAGDKQAHLETGDQLLSAENYLDAVKEYNKAISADPNFARAYANRGIAYLRMNQSPKALQDLNIAIQLAGDDDKFKKEYFYRRAMLLHQLKQYESALPDYSEALRLDGKDDPTVLRMRGRVNASLKKYPEAVSDFDKSIKSSTEPLENAWTLFERALAYKGMKKTDLSLKDFDEAIKLYERGFDGSATPLRESRNRLPAVYWERGWLYESMGKKDLAKADLARAAKLMYIAEQENKPPKSVYSESTISPRELPQGP
jgi:tetratricopeptide (TPR) repeat protein